jgi:hypothetical protein
MYISLDSDCFYNEDKQQYVPNKERINNIIYLRTRNPPTTKSHEDKKKMNKRKIKIKKSIVSKYRTIQRKNKYFMN